MPEKDLSESQKNKLYLVEKFGPAKNPSFRYRWGDHPQVIENLQEYEQLEFPLDPSGVDEQIEKRADDPEAVKEWKVAAE